jgi:hypothetical protein
MDVRLAQSGLACRRTSRSGFINNQVRAPPRWRAPRGGLQSWSLLAGDRIDAGVSGKDFLLSWDDVRGALYRGPRGLSLTLEWSEGFSRVRTMEPNMRSSH